MQLYKGVKCILNSRETLIFSLLLIESIEHMCFQ
uniref:Uncharacterized protein n=1 Tax=Arundo donax TaxID=35708 RepID=A0A0A8Y0J1_ARUDO